MRFYTALQYLFQNYKIRRGAWHPGQFIYLYVPGPTELEVKLSDGNYWAPTSKDILASDWAVVDTTSGPKLELLPTVVK